MVSNSSQHHRLRRTFTFLLAGAALLVVPAAKPLAPPDAPKAPLNVGAGPEASGAKAGAA